MSKSTKTPNGIKEITAIFGDASRADFEAKNIVSFDLPYPLLYDGKPVTRARCHELLVENFIQAFAAIKAAGLENECKNYGGIFAKRNIRGLSHPSTHSWGIAIDLESAKYPLGSSKRFPQGVIDAFKNAGFMYGGDFKGRKDPMHFQFATGY